MSERGVEIRDIDSVLARVSEIYSRMEKLRRIIEDAGEEREVRQKANSELKILAKQYEMLKSAMALIHKENLIAQNKPTLRIHIIAGDGSKILEGEFE